MSKTFNVSFISDGKYWQAGEPIPDSDIRPFMLKHYAKKAPPLLKQVVNINRKVNQPYYVNNANEMTSPVAKRQAAQMQIAAEQQELDETEANTLDATTVSALAELQDRFAANVERQKLDAQIKAEREDELDLALQEEATAQAEAGEFDEMDSDPRKPKVIGQSKASKPKSLFVERQGKFVPASTAKLIPGEVLYWHRKRDIGVSEKFIKHSNVQKGKA